MTGNPRLSVCVPTWNGGAHLGACLESILGQTYGDYELLVVDDGSSDETLEIAHGFRDPRMVVHRNPARWGLPGNWNRSLELARGELVKLVFQDDTLAPSALEKLVAALDRPSRPDLSFCRREIRHEGSLGAAPVLGDAYMRYLDAFYASAASDVAGQDLVLDWVRVGRPLATNVVGEPSFVLLRAQAARAAGGFDTRYAQLSDWDLWLRLGRQAPLAFVDESLGLFRIHETAVSAKNFGRPRLHRDHLLLLGAISRTYGPILPRAVRRKLRLARFHAAYTWAKESLLALAKGRPH